MNTVCLDLAPGLHPTEKVAALKTAILATPACRPASYWVVFGRVLVKKTALAWLGALLKLGGVLMAGKRGESFLVVGREAASGLSAPLLVFLRLVVFQVNDRKDRISGRSF